MDNAIRVSIAELLEVRADGLYAPELLSIIAGACEHLQKIDKSGVFNADYIFFAPNGKIEITLVSPAHLSEEHLPPELRDHIDEDDRASVREPQMVWCLGDLIKQSSAQAFSDAELSSLINLMTVTHVGTRPTLAKLGQMTRNRCAAGGIDVHGVLKAMYEELMGDIDELVDDATSLSGWSEVNGQGPRDKPAPPESSPSTSNSDDDGNETDEGGYVNHLPVVEEESDHRQATKVIRRDSDESTTTAMSLSSGELRSRNDSVASEVTLRTASESSEDGEKTPPAVRKSPTPEREMTPIAEDPEPATSTPLVPPVIKEPEAPIIVQKETKASELIERPFVADISKPLPAYQKPITPPPSPRNTLPSKISEEESDLDEADLPPPRVDLPPSPKLMAKASPHTVAGVVSARKKSSIVSTEPTTPIPSQKSIPETIPVQVQPRMVTDESGQLSRHNSLGLGKVHRRSSKVRKSVVTPEFVEKQSLAVIRLQAQSSRKKRLSLHRVEPTFVLVKIINGQTVEVNCKSDAYVGSVFDSVVDYFNITEHNFFGLAVVRDSEYFFLDNEQRLEKYAPPGWKSARKGNQERYLLYLRFRYYPKKLDFIKTAATSHSLYLQLRQDILYDSLKPKRDRVFELAAIALQAEFGDHPPQKLGPRVPYFQVQHYLPPRALINQDSAKVESNLSEIHSHYAGQQKIQSERHFIELCQKESDYGAHYYRVYKFKPSSHSQKLE